MADSPVAQATRDYRRWRQVPVSVADVQFSLVTKPGVFAHGQVDHAGTLLAERATVARGDTVVHMNCRNGLYGAVTSRIARRVLLTDRNILATEAARRTLDANSATNAEVLPGHGAYPLPPDLVADVVAIRIPLERVSLLQLLADAFRILRVGGTCYLAGATNEGAKTAAKVLAEVFGNGGVLAVEKGHRVMMATKHSAVVANPDALANPYVDPDAYNEIGATLRGEPVTLFTRPGVFSWDHLDEATSILAETVEIGGGESVLDLGCGCGALGLVASKLSHGGATCMVDADVEAVRSAERTATAAGASGWSALASDVAAAVLDRRFDVVVMNPPFHVGKATDLDVPAQFIRDAFSVLDRGGRLYLVANRTLPYERSIFQLFGNIRTPYDGRRFKVLSATRTSD